MKNLFLIFAFAFLLLNVLNFSYAQPNDEVVILETSSGNIVIEFFPDDASKTVDNFLNLTKNGFYDGVIFHRIIKDFMIQGGDPLSKDPDSQNQWGTGDAGYNIDAEFNTIKHNRGIVSMARSALPDSASSQFFIVHADSNFLDEQYTVFGRIVTQESFDTLDKIAALETVARDIPTIPEQAKILTAKVVQRSEISDLLELGEPERVLSLTPEQTETVGQYINEKLGISFIPPVGWSIQEPEKISPEVPDVVAIGPLAGEMNPILSVGSILADGKSLEQFIDERKTAIQPAIDEGVLKIISEETTTISGKEAYVVEALGKFPRGPNTLNVKFVEVVFPTVEKFYILTYTNAEENFENNAKDFERALGSFTIYGVDEETSDEGGGCLIATATFGSELAPQVQQLREIRDGTVLNTESGTAFMEQFNKLYYSFSPTIADMERESPAFKELVKITITPLLTTLSILNHVDIDSEAEMLGYGIGVVLLNVGMYFVAPAMIVYRLRK